MYYAFRMYSNFVLIVSFVLTLGVISNSLATAQSATELIIYTDTNNGFTLHYPSDWTKNSSNAQNFQKLFINIQFMNSI